MPASTWEVHAASDLVREGLALLLADHGADVVETGGDLTVDVDGAGVVRLSDGRHGGRVPDGCTAQQLASEGMAVLAPRLGGSHDPLAEEELTVLRLVAEGLPSPSIADRLEWSTARVDEVRRTIARRLGADSSAHAVSLAHERGLMDGTTSDA